MIADFISKAVSEIGIDESQASTATGGILNLLKDNVDAGDFSSLLGSLGGAEDLMATASSAIGGASGGGASSLLGGLASKFLGNSGLASSLGGAAGLASLLSAANINSGQLGNLASLFFDFAKENVGEELVAKLLSSVPAEIRSLVA